MKKELTFIIRLYRYGAAEPICGLLEKIENGEKLPFKGMKELVRILNEDMKKAGKPADT